MTNLNEEITKLALTKIKGDRGAIAPGEYSGEAVVHVSYSLKVGEDYEQRIVQKACPFELLALALNKLNGVTVESLVAEALAGGVDTDDLKARVTDAVSKIKGTTVTTCKGKVTGKASVVIAGEVSEGGAEVAA